VWGRASTAGDYYKARRPMWVLCITGCMAEHLRDQVACPGALVDLVVGPDRLPPPSCSTSKRRAPA